MLREQLQPEGGQHLPECTDEMQTSNCLGAFASETRVSNDKVPFECYRTGHINVNVQLGEELSIPLGVLGSILNSISRQYF